MGRKEELKADYKHNRHLLRRMGVFRITNLVNGKVYLGGSLNLDGTMERDRKWLAMGGHLNHRLQRDWNEFGAEAFEGVYRRDAPVQADGDPVGQRLDLSEEVRAE